MHEILVSIPHPPGEYEKSYYEWDRTDFEVVANMYWRLGAVRANNTQLPGSQPPNLIKMISQPIWLGQLNSNINY